MGSWAKSRQMLHSKLPASLLLLFEQEGLWGGLLLVDSPNPLSIYINLHKNSNTCKETYNKSRQCKSNNLIREWKKKRKKKKTVFFTPRVYGEKEMDFDVNYTINTNYILFQMMELIMIMVGEMQT